MLKIAHTTIPTLEAFRRLCKETIRFYLPESKQSQKSLYFSREIITMVPKNHCCKEGECLEKQLVNCLFFNCLTHLSALFTLHAICHWILAGFPPFEEYSQPHIVTWGNCRVYFLCCCQSNNTRRMWLSFKPFWCPQRNIAIFLFIYTDKSLLYLY